MSALTEGVVIQEIADRLHHGMQDAVYEKLKETAINAFMEGMEATLREAAKSVVLREVQAVYDQLRMGTLVGVDVRINGVVQR